MKNNVCSEYCGVNCVNGNCPQIVDEQYDCKVCWLYKGCKDCYFSGDCAYEDKKGE